MNFLSHFNDSLSDGRLGANLIAIHGLITLAVLVALILRRLIAQGSTRMARWTGIRWLEAASEEAARRVRSLLFWLTLATIGLSIVAGVCYHLAGRDIRHDLTKWYEQFTILELVQLGAGAAEIAGIIAGTWFLLRLVRRLVPYFESEMKVLLGKMGNAQIVHNWFVLVHFYTLVAVRLTGLWGICKIAGAGHWADKLTGFLIRVLTIVIVARLLTLACRILTQVFADFGDRYLAKAPFENYWERCKRLFSFGERCIDAAVYVTAASACVKLVQASEQDFLSWVTEFGPHIVRCIGIFFVTRVVIELVQVLVSQAFGLYGEEEYSNQKGRTLAPLINSICQYVLYFGSALVMLNVLGINTTPILAGVSILGLAVGLGAQSLVTDVVSGFFILFENQYLVGDYIQVGDAVGVVEAVGIRVTHIRDGQGKVYIIPNGQIKGVVSYSKGFINAVVDLKVPTGSDLEGVFRSMAEAGRLLRQAHSEVLADTRIQGLVDLGTTEMTVRAVTKVRPGAHAAMQNEYRRILKQVLDQKALASKPAMAA
jgi:moderate conductance mechanosensitive channel